MMAEASEGVKMMKCYQTNELTEQLFKTIDSDPRQAYSDMPDLTRPCSSLCSGCTAQTTEVQ